MTMKAAQDMGKRRWQGKKKAERVEHATMMAAARQAKTTPEQRSAAAKKAALARWAKKKGKKR